MHVRDAIRASAQDKGGASLGEFLQPVASLPSSMPLIDAVSSLRTQRGQLALVRDEQGRVVGMTSMEDILEQILGEFDDESDAETPDEQTPAHAQSSSA